MSRPTSPATIQARILGISTRSFKANFGSAERYLAMKPEAQALMVNMARREMCKYVPKNKKARKR